MAYCFNEKLGVAIASKKEEEMVVYVSWAIVSSSRGIVGSVRRSSRVNDPLADGRDSDVI
jgi:hypothetical protein